MPALSTPRSVAWVMVKPLDNTAPTVAQGTPNPDPRIAGTADDAQGGGLANINRAHLQTIGLRVRHCGGDLPDHDAGEARVALGQHFTFQPGKRQSGGQVCGRLIERHPFTQPVQTQFHDSDTRDIDPRGPRPHRQT
ncbi:MAG: hypothetical protein KKC55_11510 [Gammaproteobacteria bacterium]|nr:hypothetical protein [Gammaproteobacteria bacterium]